MKSIFLIFIIYFAYAQIPQHLTAEFENLANETRLWIISSTIFDENQPLTIETVNNGLDSSVTNLIADFFLTSQIQIEVFHPSISERFPNVRTLQLQTVRMRRIGFNSFTNCPQNLENLWLGENLIQEIPGGGLFRHCRSLRWLDLSNNQITRIDPDAFLGLTNLNSLYIQSNQISTISPSILANLQSIESFKASGNPIQVIEPRSFPSNLRELLLDGCSITFITPEMFDNNFNLEILDLGRNPIVQLPSGVFNRLASLKSFGLYVTNIQRLNSSAFTRHLNLESMEFQFGALNAIEPGFFDNFPGLQNFNSRGNFCLDDLITNFQSIDVNRVFAQCFGNWLIILILTLVASTIAQNDQAIMTEVSSHTELQIRAAIVLDENLPLRIETSAQVRDEEITQLINILDPSNPVFLDVFHPSIFARFWNLNTVSIWLGRVRRIVQNSFERCENLHKMFLTQNLIEELPVGNFRNCRNLTLLSLTRNRINKLNPEVFLGLSSLNYLDFEGNFLTSIESGSFTSLPALQTLFLSSNPISEIQPAAFPSQLSYLGFFGCQISQLHPQTFHNLTNLSFLSLQSNPITELPSGIFSHLSSLQTLLLSSTNIRRLNANSFGRHELPLQFVISDCGLDEIQPGFFDNFLNLTSFQTIGNACANVELVDVHLIDFNENRVLHQCFANWFVPRP